MNEPIKTTDDLRAHEKAVDRLKRELETWKTELDELKVQASLAKLESKQKASETLDAFERRSNEVEATLREWKESGRKEWDAATESLQAGWEK
ncbi:MAG: hypothetical protein ACF8XB_09905, partial [Planctomycetota bacterium JB042]